MSYGAKRGTHDQGSRLLRYRRSGSCLREGARCGVSRVHARRPITLHRRSSKSTISRSIFCACRTASPTRRCCARRASAPRPTPCTTPCGCRVRGRSSSARSPGVTHASRLHRWRGAPRGNADAGAGAGAARIESVPEGAPHQGEYGAVGVGHSALATACVGVRGWRPDGGRHCVGEGRREPVSARSAQLREIDNVNGSASIYALNDPLPLERLKCRSLLV